MSRGIRIKVQNYKAGLPTVNDQSGFVVVARDGITKNTFWLVTCYSLCDVLITPWRPQKIHEVNYPRGKKLSRSAKESSSSRENRFLVRLSRLGMATRSEEHTSELQSPYV